MITTLHTALAPAGAATAPGGADQGTARSHCAGAVVGRAATVRAANGSRHRRPTRSSTVPPAVTGTPPIVGVRKNGGIAATGTVDGNVPLHGRHSGAGTVGPEPAGKSSAESTEMSATGPGDGRAALGVLDCCR